MLNNVTVKQADVTLLIHPLNWGSLDEQWQNLAYYDQKQSPDGPAMTHAISTVAMNRIAKSGCSAFTRQLKAQLPNLRAPWFQMSEQADDDQNTNGGIAPSFPFLTGSGGSLQIPLYGYLGYNLLKNDMTIRPALPAPLKHLQIADFHFGGNLFKASMNSTHTNMTRLPAQDPGLYDAFKGRPMPLIVEHRSSSEYAISETAYNISMNQTITVANDIYWEQLTVPNNLLQCQPTTSGGPFIAANPPGAATDGDAGTRWQPLTQKASNITIETNNVPSQRVTELKLDFGPRTPKYVRVAFTNRTDLASVWDADPIILEPIPKAMPNEKVALYQGNTTMYNVSDGHWSGKYTILEVEGCQGCGELLPVRLDNGTTYWQDDGLGAFVAEFAAVGETGIDLVKTLKEVSADERQGGKGDVVDAQDAHASALTDSLEFAGIE